MTNTYYNGVIVPNYDYDYITQKPPTGELVINGSLTKGNKLTLESTVEDPNGVDTAGIFYQWFRDDLPIKNATQITYLLTELDVGKSLHVVANYTDFLANPESVTSSAVKILGSSSEPTYKLSVKNANVDEGESVTFKLKTTNVETGTAVPFVFMGSISEEDVSAGFNEKEFIVQVDGTATLTIAFLADKLTENIEKLTLSLNEVDESININVNDTSKTPNNLVKGDVTIMGAISEKSILKIENTLADTDGLGSFSYQWFSAGKAIKGATQEIYTLTKKDINQKISASISFTDKLGNVESKISAETEIVTAFDPNIGIIKAGTKSRDKLVGQAKNDSLSGLAGADELIGNAGNDYLNGGGGNDSLDGGTGNDKLIGDDGNDKLIGGSGNDHLEGSAGNDTLKGDAGVDTLSGGAGVDNMTGGDGNDYYFVDNVKDVINETSKNVTTGGSDTVESISDYVLPENIENFVLKDLAGKGHKATGNKLDNIITGSIGDDVLNGGAGNDKLNGNDGVDSLNGDLGIDILSGGKDSDVYYINNLEDKIIEEIDGGEEDHIISTESYELTTSKNVEWLTLSGNKAKMGEGNELNNLLQEVENGTVANDFKGYDGNDTINGEGGNDMLEGGNGNDVLNGGDGKDLAIFNADFFQYKITPNADANQIIVEYIGDIELFNEGEDILSDIETLQFADQTISAELILTGTALLD
jgi:Ca2+-binding RTX toxin-like protein